MILFSATKRIIPVLVMLLGLPFTCAPKIEFDTIITSQLEKKDYLDVVVGLQAKVK